MLASGLDPATVADQVVEAVLARRLDVLTHPEWSPRITARVQRIVDGQNPPTGSLPAQ